MHRRVLESIRLPLDHPLFFTIFSLCLYLYGCISPSYTILSPSSIDCNIVVMDILQTSPWWTHEREVMCTILPYQLLTELQHPDRIANHEYMCVLPVDIPRTEIHSSLRSITDSVWPLQTQPPLNEFCRFSMLHQFYALQFPQMLEH